MIDGITVCEMHNNLQSSKNLISTLHATKGIENVLKLERHGEDEASEREKRHDLEKVHQQSMLIQTECIIEQENKNVEKHWPQTEKKT